MANAPDVKAVFDAALDYPAGRERSTFLDAACRGDTRVRARVEAMLKAHDDETDDDAPAVSTDALPIVMTLLPETKHPSPRPVVEEAGARVGPYKLLQKLGEGGMGVVYMAEQDAPVRRRVALKVIKPGMDSELVLARFEAERQALAMMDHPNIARVLDAGTTEGGRPYFVMELVKGVPITRYCDESRLPPRERLGLFIPVCQAIQHAHQKGIIHRDVKPSNVLVAMADGKPVAKVIDFGVAKAIDQRLTERTLFTRVGGVVGTLEYMSPEQAETSGLDVDTRTDVYALGVLLYELLTGTTPLERDRLQRAGYDEILRRIREEEPPKPSTRLSGSGDQLASVAARRGTEPARLTRSVRGELDWIVMKALEKDRTRRYETANGFARDVQRYLDGDPVEAGPPSAGYRLRKLARKHRAALTVTAGFAAMLAGAAAVSTALAFRADAQRRRALDAEHRAERRLTQIEKANDLLASVFRDLDPRAEQKGGKPLGALLGERLDRAAAELDGEAIGDPLTVAGLQDTLGVSQLNLGYPDRAIALLARAARTREARLGADHPDTLSSRNNLAVAYRFAGRTAEAVALHEETLRRRSAVFGPDHAATLDSRNNLAEAYLAAGRAGDAAALHEGTLKRRLTALGPDHPDTLMSRNNLAEAYRTSGRFTEAAAMHEETLRRRAAVLGADHPDTLDSRNNLAEVYRHVGRFPEAIALNEETLKRLTASLGADHPDTLNSRNNLAECLRVAGRAREAVALNEETLKLLTAKLGADHPNTLMSRNNLAVSLLGAGRTREAIALHEESVRRLTAKLGPDHPDTLTSRSNLAGALVEDDRATEAVAMHEETLRRRTAVLGADHPDTLSSRNNLALAYWMDGRTAEAIPLYEETLKRRTAVLGADHPDTLRSRNNLAVAYADAGRTSEAVAIHQETLTALTAALGPDHPSTLQSRNNLAEAYRVAGRLTEAAAMHEEALRLLTAALGADHPRTLTSVGNLAATYEALGRWAEAEPLRRDLLGRQRKASPPGSAALASSLATLGTNLISQRKWSEAEPVLRECLAVREKLLPDDWSRFNTMSQLGGALLGQGRYAEAEPLVVAGYEGLKAREAKLPRSGRRRLPEAAARLVPLYQAWGRPDTAAAWRAKLAATETLPADPFQP